MKCAVSEIGYSHSHQSVLIRHLAESVHFAGLRVRLLCQCMPFRLSCLCVILFYWRACCIHASWHNGFDIRVWFMKMLCAIGQVNVLSRDMFPSGEAYHERKKYIAKVLRFDTSSDNFDC